MSLLQITGLTVGGLIALICITVISRMIGQIYDIIFKARFDKFLKKHHTNATKVVAKAKNMIISKE